MTAVDRLTPDRLLAALSRHVGRERGITIGNLVFEATGRAPDTATERRARELIVELRMTGQHICGHPSSGYWIAASADELDAACTFLVDRAMTSLRQVAAMRRVSLPDLYGQLRLPN
jgi:hypothetical protein